MNIIENYLAKKKETSLVKEQEIIKQIHFEFDSAEDRLLKEAKALLEKMFPPTEHETEKIATRLKSLGFSETPLIKKAEDFFKIRKNEEIKKALTQQEADLISYYKRTYPLLKFLTVSELERICKKYNLIYAPVKYFIKDVPHKNIEEMERAKLLNSNDIETNIAKLFIHSSNLTNSRYRNLLKKGFLVNGMRKHDMLPLSDSISKALNISKSDARDCIIYDYSDFDYKIINKEGLFICAPTSHFNLKDLSKETDLGHFEVKKFEVNDPIVFRYCKGGVQVLSKWGLEASDEALVNEINN